MARSIRLALTLALLAALAVGAGSAEASPGGHKILDTRLVGSSPPQILAGVPAATRSWTLVRGNAKLFADGRIELRVHGLLLGPGDNVGTNPIATGRAILSCNGGGTGNVVPSPAVPFSPEGDAHVQAVLTVPSPCRAPTIFFGNSGGTAWFAVSG